MGVPYYQTTVVRGKRPNRFDSVSFQFIVSTRGRSESEDKG